MTELKGLEAHIGCGRGVKAIVNGRNVLFKIVDEPKGIIPFDFNNNPEIILEVLKKFEKINPGFEPSCLLLQTKNAVGYIYKRIL